MEHPVLSPVNRRRTPSGALQDWALSGDTVTMVGCVELPIGIINRGVYSHGASG